MATKDSSRLAGVLERYHITSQYLRLDCCVVVAGKFYHPTIEQLSKDAVFSAIAHAVDTHAALSAKIVDEKGPNPRFTRLSEVRLDQVVRFLSAEDSRSVAETMEEEFHRSPIDASKDLPLWRITVSSDNHIYYAWHHAIGDGNSGPIVLRTILEGLNINAQNSPGESIRVVKPKADLRLTPPVEELTDLSVRFKTLLSEIIESLTPLSWRLRKVWTGGKVAKDITASTKNRVRVVSIDADTAARVLSSARAHKTTITAVLYILTVNVLTTLVSQQTSKKKYKQLAATIPVSFRKLAQLPPDVIADAVSICISYSRLDREFTWEKAASFAEKLHENVPDTRETIGSLKYLHGRYEHYFKKKYGKKRAHSFVLSNLGAIRAEEGAGDSNWQLGDTYFAQDDRYLGGAVKLNVVGSPSGSLNICLTWGEDAVRDEFVESLANDLEVSFLRLSTQE